MQTAPQSSEQSNSPPIPIKALRIKDVLEKTGLSRTHTYRLIERGDHPKPLQLSERVFLWDEADIDEWLIAKFKEAR